MLTALQIEEHELYLRDNRIPVSRHHNMLALAAQQLSIPGIILRIGIKSSPDKMGVVGHLMMNSETLLDAGYQITRFASLLSETGLWSIQQYDDSYQVQYTVNDPGELQAEVEQASLSACLGTLQSLCKKQIRPLEVSFTHHDPGYADVYQEVFGIPVSFEHARCAVRIAARDAQQAIPHQQSYLLELLYQHAESLLTQYNAAGSVTTRVRELVITYLPEGRADIEGISQRMNMSRWTLTRHLKSEGVTFNALLRQIRRELAGKYLNDQNISISEAGFLLGYSEPSAFQRAFRSWYSCTPTEFRTQH